MLEKAMWLNLHIKKDRSDDEKIKDYRAKL